MGIVVKLVIQGCMSILRYYKLFSFLILDSLDELAFHLMPFNLGYFFLVI